MSEPATRGAATRGGRGSVRGGRGGYSSRGGRGGSIKTTKSAASAFEDQGEIGQLKSKYADSVKTVKEIFPQFTDEDVVVALEENGGDLEATINKISSGAVSQWEDAGKKKDKPKTSKSNDLENGHISAKAGRGRGGSDSARGSRGRASERGRGASRGAKGAANIASNAKPNAAPPTTSDSAWEVGGTEPVTSTEASTAGGGGGAWGTDAASESTSTPATWDVAGSTKDIKAVATGTEKPIAKPNGTRSWADLMKPAPKPKPVAVEKPAIAPVPIAQVPEPPATVQELPAEPIVEPEAATPPAAATDHVEQLPPTASPSLPPSEPATNIAPSDDKLTEENLEQVKDVSHPLATDTVASTVGTEDPRSIAGTPLHNQTAPAKQQPTGGFATTALKATQGNSRPSSFHRKLREQSEAVVMPGKHAVDRAAVQFGSLGLGGSTDDVDDDREEAETREQPPQPSPIAPRASLPSAPQLPVPPVETAPTPRAAPGLTADPSQASGNNISSGSQPTETQQPQQPQSSYDQFNNRFGLPATQPSATANVSKPYEPFGQQLAGTPSHPFDTYGAQSQAPGQQSQNAPSYMGGFGGNDYSSYEYQRNQMYGGFGQQQPGQASQESSVAQRASSGFGTSAADTPSQYASAQVPQNRFGATASDALNSGHSTPAPAAGQAAQSHGQNHAHTHGHHMAGHGQAGGHAPYGNYYGGAAAYNNAFYNQHLNSPSHHQPYGRDRPAFDDARRYEDSYMSQQNHHYGYGQYGSYGTGPYGGKYGAGPSQYGVSPQTSYDTHSASPANAFGRDSGPGFGSYGRTGSTHPDSTQHSQHSGSGAYGGMADAFGRNSSAFGSQASQQQSQQGTGDESSRYGGDSKLPAGGPSPAPNQQRPGSATNTAPGGPGNQPQNQGYGGYPQSGLGGFGAHQAGQHHGTYGNYGGGFSAPYYGGGRGNTWGYGTS